MERQRPALGRRVRSRGGRAGRAPTLVRPQRVLGLTPPPAVAWEPVGEPGIYLRQLELGPMQNFVYLVGDPVARECVVVDPAWEIDTIVDTARADGMRLTGALVTHTIKITSAAASPRGGCPAASPAWRSCSRASRSRCTSTRRNASSCRGWAPTSCRSTTTTRCR